MDTEAPLVLRLPKAAARKLADGGFETVNDLLSYAPTRYYQWGKLTDISSLVVGEHSTILARVVSASVVQNRSGKGVRFLVQVTDGSARLTCTFFAKNAYMLSHHQRLLRPGSTVLISGKVGEYHDTLQMVQPEFEEVEEGSEIDAARRAGRPIPIYRTISGLPSWKIASLIDALLNAADDKISSDVVPDDVRTTHALFGHDKAIRMLHQPESPIDWQTARRSLAWEEALILQTALLGSRTGAVTQREELASTPGHSAAGRRSAPSLISGSKSPATHGRDGTATHEDAVLEASADALAMSQDSSGQKLVEHGILTTGATPATGRDRDLVTQLTQSLPFNLTASQQQAWNQIEIDIAQSAPMQRLLQGDVGSGKTVVALLAMLRAVESGYQAAMLAPTEVLARQHWYSLTAMLDRSGIQVPVHLLTSKRAAGEKNQVLSSLSSGEPSIVVGTHALLQDTVEVPNLGLVVVDEQHRFGVAQREQLRRGRRLVPHLLVMTATPIPRTIAMTVFGDLDVTAMSELPQGRKPIETFLVDERNTLWMDRMWQRAREEIDRGGRVYVVCPRIEADETEESDNKPTHSSSDSQSLPAAMEVVEQLRAKPVFAGINIGLAHGRARPDDNAAAFAAFASGSAPLLVATTVVEVGVDVPEATMMVILDGTRFGLSQLHQLRGRVGRSNTPSVCMITFPGEISETSSERLQAIAATNDGFALAEIDLRLRKEGDVLGKNQSGHVSGLQFLSVRRDASVISAARETAHQILSEDPTLENHADLAGAARKRAGDDLVWMESS